jgi:hypothetical protein
VGIWQRAFGFDWYSVIPTWGLLWQAERDTLVVDTSLWRELAARFDEGRMSGEEVSSLADMLVSRRPRVLGVTTLIRDQLVNRMIAQGLCSEAQLGVLLEEVVPRIEIRPRVRSGDRVPFRRSLERIKLPGSMPGWGAERDPSWECRVSVTGWAIDEAPVEVQSLPEELFSLLERRSDFAGGSWEAGLLRAPHSRPGSTRSK